MVCRLHTQDRLCMYRMNYKSTLRNVRRAKGRERLGPLGPYLSLHILVSSLRILAQLSVLKSSLCIL